MASDKSKAKSKVKRNRSALKRERQARKRYLRNKAMKTRIKNFLKKIDLAIKDGNREIVGNLLKEATSLLMKAASKGIIHKNTASRKISRLTIKVNKFLSSQAA